MNKIQRVVDLNAHINQLECSVLSENENAFGIISFVNKGYGTLTAVKFSAKGFNSFSDILTVNEKKEFIVILQDLNIAPRKNSGKLKVKLPNSQIRKLILIEEQVCYLNGDVFTYEGVNDADYEIECLNKNVESESKILEILIDYESSAVCLPANTEKGWICICGNLNKRISNQCGYCSKDKKFIFSICTEDSIRASIEKKRLQKEEKEKQQHNQLLTEQAEQAKLQEEDRLKEKQFIAKKKRQNKKYILIVFIVLMTTILCYIAYKSAQLSKLVTFNTEEEMKEYIAGTWVCSLYDNALINTLVITPNGVYEYDGTVGQNVSETLFDEVIYYPKQGYFITYVKIYLFETKYFLTKNMGGKAILTRKDNSLNRKDNSSSCSYSSSSTARLKDIYKSNVDEEVWQYCHDRWDYYDALEGGYSGDKYTAQVFEDAATKFDISPTEAELIWDKVDRKKLGLD